MASAYISISRINLSHRAISPSISSKRRYTTIARVAQNQSYWESIQSDIDSHLKKAIPIREPLTVFEPMHHLTFSPPRTSASALCVAACELVGGNRADAIVAASAIHLMHADIYVHDNMLLTDRVEPRPTIPHKFDPQIELMTGDGIMPFGFELLAGSMDPASNNADKILRVIIEISRAIGSEAMVSDQDHEANTQIHRLHESGAASGAILGGGNEEEIERLKKFGLYAGKIQGLLNKMGKNEEGKIEKWRALALKELEHFDSKKIEQISTIVTGDSLKFSYVGKS
uniref:Geranyl pyrophosphate synthase 1 small subunit n=1 Tax=Chrysanthemum morifolium TaxID=41568 RepID=A0A288ILI7_CHRMO|nr:geranyl pyrophosphate synthase 1 small subunit [Chrysanthemum x morifolium]